MEKFNQQTPNVQSAGKNAFSVNLIFKIAGALAVVFLLFLPVAGCENSGQYGGYDMSSYTVNGLDFIEGLFKQGSQIDATSILFLLSMISGVVIIFLNKPLQFIIGGISGLGTFLIAFLITKSKQGGEIVVLKIGAYLALLFYAGIAVAALIRLLSLNKTAAIAPPYTSQPVFYPPKQTTLQQPVQQQYQAPTHYQQPPPQQPIQQPARSQKFCGKCGYKFPENYTGKFCSKCGAKRLY
jgi:hypothetical protein